jgi:hypothetical protein
MSAIDVYRHNHLGFIECPSSYDFVFASKTRKIAIYELLDNIPDDEMDFDGKAGDILVGGGSGEAPALRISNPIAFQFSTYDEDKFADLEFNDLEEIFKPFWAPTQSFMLGEGFLKLGWTPDRPLEMWLTENVCKLLVSAIDKFSIYKDDKVDLTTNLTLIRGA